MTSGTGSEPKPTCIDCDKGATHGVWDKWGMKFHFWVCDNHSKAYICDGFYVRGLTHCVQEVKMDGQLEQIYNEINFLHARTEEHVWSRSLTKYDGDFIGIMGKKLQEITNSLYRYNHKEG